MGRFWRGCILLYIDDGIKKGMIMAYIWAIIEISRNQPPLHYTQNTPRYVLVLLIILLVCMYCIKTASKIYLQEYKGIIDSMAIIGISLIEKVGLPSLGSKAGWISASGPYPHSGGWTTIAIICGPFLLMDLPISYLSMLDPWYRLTDTFPGECSGGSRIERADISLRRCRSDSIAYSSFTLRCTSK